MLLWIILVLLNVVYYVFCEELDATLALSRRSQCKSKLGTSIYNTSRVSDYSYGDDPAGPDNWPAMFAPCDGDKQSPINIDMSDLRRLKTSNLIWSSAYFNTPQSMTLTHIGHKLILRAEYPADCKPKLSGGPLHQTYTLKWIEFHWGSSNSKGSEHTIDEYAYPMEMQVVHESGMDFDRHWKTVIVAYFFQVLLHLKGLL